MEVVSLLRADRDVVLWWASPVECQSALFRVHRDGALPANPLGEALLRLTALVEDAHIVAPTSRLRERAGRLLALHAVRASDALQLAAALAWSDEPPHGSGFVCLDDRLRTAARSEGFAVLPK